MTVTDETVDTTEDTTGEADEQNETEGESNSGRKREQDFTKYREFHEDLAAFINANAKFIESGQTSVTPNQVKAVLNLRTDFANTPEQVAKREQRKAEVEAKKARYAGMTDEQIKAAKAAERAAAQAAKFEAKAAEAMKRAEELKAQASASGEDLAAVVNGAEPIAEEPQAEESTEEPTKRRGLGRRR
jgi:predicted ribosome quality control (RQC) complex YloA/Tae2 family protein